MRSCGSTSSGRRTSWKRPTRTTSRASCSLSSVGALGFSFPKHPCLPDYLPVDTAHPRRPQDVYGLSKLMNEESAPP